MVKRYHLAVAVSTVKHPHRDPTPGHVTRRTAIAHTAGEHNANLGLCQKKLFGVIQPALFPDPLSILVVPWLEGVLQPDWCTTQLGCLLPSSSLVILDAMCFREETSTDVTAVCLIEQEWSNPQEIQRGMTCPLIRQSSVGQSAARFEICPWTWLAIPN